MTEHWTPRPAEGVASPESGEHAAGPRPARDARSSGKKKGLLGRFCPVKLLRRLRALWPFRGSDSAPKEVGDRAFGPSAAFELHPFVSFATQQARVEVLRQLRIDNPTAQDLAAVELRMTFDPEIAASKAWRVPRVRAGESFEVEDPRVRLRAGYLAAVTDSFSANVVLEMSVTGQERGEWSQQLQVLGRTHWGGYALSPEHLAAFCLPNDRAVEQVLRRAAAIMRDEGRSPALTGYDSANSDRVREMANAVWSAVASIGIEYAYPQVSFAAPGQRIRPPSAIVSDQRATCLDLAMLFCAALEQAYLHPVVVLEKTHAYVGIHLVPSDLPADGPVLSDSRELKRRVRADTLLVFETTAVTKEPQPFQQAIESGRGRALRVRNRFEHLVDIRACRMAGIMPLALHDGADPIDLTPYVQPPPMDVTAVPIGASAIDRLAKWKAKLLDLSPSNPLMDLPRDRIVPLDAPDPAVLPSLLAESSSTGIVSADSSGADAATGGGAAHAALSADELDRRLEAIRERDRSAREEGGASVLFLTIGTLRWHLQGDAESELASPLVMIPVSLHRASRVARWQMRYTEGTPFLNPALGAALDSEYEMGLEKWEEMLPPCDVQDVDVSGVLQGIADLVGDIPDSSVQSDLSLGTFGFRKLFMWRDLTVSADQLVRNRLVRHIADSPTERYVWGGGIPSPDELDDLVDPRTLCTPLETDASQLSAVVASRHGSDFVMIGPPGTGKSQTIANMIAQGIADGKTILFSAQKTVALDVVYARLRELGLHHFCLYIRPGQDDAGSVVGQLRRSWSAATESSNEVPVPQHSSIRRLQDELNLYPEAIHEEHPNGLTIHWALGAFADSRNLPVLDFGWPSIWTHDAEQWGDMASLATTLGKLAREAWTAPPRCLDLIDWSNWSMKWEATLLGRAEVTSAACRRLEEAAEHLLAALGGRRKKLTLRRARGLARLAGAVRKAPQLADALRPLTLAADPMLVVRSAAMCVRLSRTIAKEKARLSTEYRGDVLGDVDLQGVRELLNSRTAADQERGRRRWREGAKPKGQCRTRKDVDLWIAINDAGLTIRDLAEHLKDFPAWSGTGTPAELDRVAEVVDVARALVAATEWVDLTLDDLIAPEDLLLTVCKDYQEEVQRWSSGAEAFGESAGRTVDATPSVFDDIRGLAKLLDDLAPHRHLLQLRCTWNRASFDATASGIGDLAVALRTGRVASGDARRAFEGSYARWWLQELIDGDSTLRTFTRVERERSIKRLQVALSDARDAAPTTIRARLWERIPSISQGDVSGQYRILKRETAKGRRFRPLRRLFVDAEEAVAGLTPCMIMSPIAVARHLSPDREPFDIVIVDEASQLPVSEAIGIVGRGKQTIIVGDPKQLPPTGFSESTWDEPEDTDPDRVDLDSILEEAVGASVPHVVLNWHYRSRTDSLIQFSNRRYYRGRLMTVPSRSTSPGGMMYVQVSGDYDGKTDTNLAEARAVVREVLGQLRDANGRRSSMGVVTVNRPQRDLVAALLQEQRQQHEDLDALFQRETSPFFVKQIENAQGDERDVIFLGMTYGRGSDGHAPRRFGSLSGDGGERRLNVAITRARRAMVVLSSLDPDDIDAARAGGQGVEDLRAFLRYAQEEGGDRKTLRAVTARAGSASPFEVAVAREIERAGWTTHLHIGDSSAGDGFHRIDIGVVDPRDPARYLAGVECDGDSYRLYSTASDRDALRPALLAARGWKSIRVWSLDYFRDPRGTMDEVFRDLEAICPPSSDPTTDHLTDERHPTT